MNEQKKLIPGFYGRLREDSEYKKHLEETDQKFIKELENNLKHSLWQHQKEALSVLDFFINARDDYYFKDKLKEKKYENVSFYGFQMATGSGKTLLIGANILYLHRTKGYKRFLIITPNTTIYEKTIRNFSLMRKECVYRNLNLDFNLMTGDNYVDSSSNYDPSVDFDVYVFNIQKFFDRKSGKLKVDKEWETSAWKDRAGNTISFREFLKQKRLVIITDEAHHYQRFRVGSRKQSSGDVILELNPDLVLEDNATEDLDDRWGRTQKIIYNYPINDFISDKYAKKIRAYGYRGAPLFRRKTAEVTKDDKKKVITSILVHLVKKRALEDTKVKPILMVRAREILHAEELLDYIKSELPEDEEIIERTYKEITQAKKYEITSLVSAEISLDDLKEEILKLPAKTFAFHTDNDDDEDVKRKFDNIEENDQEILIQVKKAEEGWNVNNVYTILVLTNSRGPLKTYVKQLIGRGVRLPWLKRKYDGLFLPLTKQQELLHVVCDITDNFKKFVEEIREEMGLSEEALEEENIKHITKKNDSIATVDKFNDLYLPVLNIIKRSKMETSDDVLDNLTPDKLRIKEFVEENTNLVRGKRWLNLSTTIGEERGIDEDIDLERGEGKISLQKFDLEEREIREVIREVIGRPNVLPSTPETREKLKDCISTINEENIWMSKPWVSREHFAQDFIKRLLNHLDDEIEKFYTLRKVSDEKLLKEIFQEYDFEAKKNVESGKWENIKDNAFVDPSDARSGFWIKGFDKSYYKFNSFDSSSELKLARALDRMKDVEFWVRNRRNYWVNYKAGHKFYPDFIVKAGEQIYIVEVKSRYEEEERSPITTAHKKEALKDLDSEEYTAIYILDSTIDDKIYKKTHTFGDIVKNNDLYRKEKKGKQQELSADQ